MKVPVIRQDGAVSPLVIEPTRRLSGIIATLNRPKRDNETEADWQTVTTDRPIEPPSFKTEGLINGAGSSLADVSDAPWQHFCQCDNGSTEKIIQHPVADACHGSYALRNDKQTNRPMMIPKLPNQNPGFPHNSGRNISAPQSRAAAAIRLFSDTFRRDPAADRPTPRVIEMETFGHSYESLSSEQGTTDPRNVHVGTSPWQSSKFRWSRIQHNLGRDPPQSPLTVFDQPLYRPEITEPNPARESSHVPHDEFLNEIPRLPFPLISLPEAAMLQHFRRERGEEDHTEPAGSFTGKSRSGTVSTISSSHVPWTPITADFGRSSGTSPCTPKPPPLAHRASRLHEVHSPTTSKPPSSSTDVLASNP